MVVFIACYIFSMGVVLAAAYKVYLKATPVDCHGLRPRGDATNITCLIILSLIPVGNCFIALGILVTKAYSTIENHIQRKIEEK